MLIASMVGFTEDLTAEWTVGEGGAGSSESPPLHAKIITAISAAKNSMVFCRQEFINDSMKSLRTSHNGSFVTSTSVMVSNDQRVHTYGA